MSIENTEGLERENQRLRHLAIKLYEQWVEAMPYVGTHFLLKHGHADTAASLLPDLPWLGDFPWVRKLAELAAADLAVDTTAEDSPERQAAVAKYRAIVKEFEES